MRDRVRALLSMRRTHLADVERTQSMPERLLALSDLTGTAQLYELVSGELIQLTGLPEPVAGAQYVPGARQAVLTIDSGGNERHQLYLIDLDVAAAAVITRFAGLRALTAEPRFGHRIAGLSPDGRALAYLSNRANGVDFDLWLCDLETGEQDPLYAGGSFCQPASGFSPGGRFVSVLQPGDRPLDVDLVLVEVATGQALIPLPHREEAAMIGPPAWSSDSVFHASSNVGRDFAAVVRHDLGSGETSSIPGTGEEFDADVVASADGAIVVIENRDGASAMWPYDTVTGTRGATIPLSEPGVTHAWFLAPPAISQDGARIHYTLSSPRLAGDIYTHDLRHAAGRRVTHTPAELGQDDLVAPELHETQSFDGERLRLFVFRPPSSPEEWLSAERGESPLAGRGERPPAGRGEKPPAVVYVHGGPEAQAMRFFDTRIQALVAGGFAVVVPNVRGSTGYGKRFASLDDTTRRLDSVRDLQAIHEALDALGLDSARAALWGASYGGYMTLAGLAFQPDLWAAGVDIVGISNLVTFLENTSDYRRAQRELEYGSLNKDREFLIGASPLTHADAIKAPLFVIHGRNDPRVPVAEAEQLAVRLKRRGVRCELVIYEDEGHGLARLDNQLDAYPRAIDFLSEVLVPSAGTVGP